MCEFLTNLTKQFRPITSISNIPAKQVSCPQTETTSEKQSDIIFITIRVTIMQQLPVVVPLFTM
jgi:hypothetical protein